MEYKFLTLFFLVMVLVLPLVAADIRIECPNTPINTQGSVNCAVKTTTALSNVGTIQFNIDRGSLFSFPSSNAITGLSGVSFNPATGQGTYSNPGGLNFNTNDILFQINLVAGTQLGTGSVMFTRFVVRDVNTNPLNTGPLAVSNPVRVGGLTSATLSLSCNLSSVSTGGSVSCAVRTDTALVNVGTIQFTFEEGALFDFTTSVNAITELSGVSFNPSNGQGTYSNPSGINFNANQVLFNVNLVAGSQAGADTTSFSRLIIRDVDTNLINTGSLPVSNQITVTSAIPPRTADLSLVCSPASVQTGGSVACAVRTNSNLNNVGSIRFTFDDGALFDIDSLTGLPGVTFNPADGRGSYTSASGISFVSGSTLFTVNLVAGTVAGSSTTSFSRFLVTDPATNPISIGSLPVSNQITVTSQTTCVAVPPTACTAGIRCVNGAATPDPATGCSNGQICGANNVCVQQLPRCGPANLAACTNSPECVAAGGNFVNGRCVERSTGPGACGCTVEGQSVNPNCQVEAGWDIVNGRCTKLLQNIKTEIESGSNKLSVLASIAGWFRTLFDGLFS